MSPNSRLNKDRMMTSYKKGNVKLVFKTGLHLIITLLTTVLRVAFLFFFWRPQALLQACLSTVRWWWVCAGSCALLGSSTACSTASSPARPSAVTALHDWNMSSNLFVKIQLFHGIIRRTSTSADLVRHGKLNWSTYHRTCQLLCINS